MRAARIKWSNSEESTESQTSELQPLVTLHAFKGEKLISQKILAFYFSLQKSYFSMLPRRYTDTETDTPPD